VTTLPDEPVNGEPVNAEPVGAEPRSSRRGRRVSTEPPPGTDPQPQREPPRHRADENDERLKADKPPHWQ